MTYGDTVVAWSSERVRHRAVAKVLVEGPRRQFSGVIRLRRHEYARGGSVNVTATLSGTPVSKEVQVDVPSPAFQVGDNCTADSDCRDADGFCLKVCALYICACGRRDLEHRRRRFYTLPLGAGDLRPPACLFAVSIGRKL